MENSNNLLTVLSREIRTHMNSIMGFSFLIKGNCLQETNVDYSNQISGSCNQLLMLIENYFEYALMDKNNFEVSPSKIRLDNILETLFSEIKSELNIDNKKIVLTSSNNNSDDPVVNIDSVKVIRALRGLIWNVINNTKSGSIKIGYQYDSKELTFYILSASQDCDKYKELLRTVDLDESLANYNDINSAINIVLTKKIIQLLCGSIWVDEYENKGTGVFFSVPVVATNCMDSCANEFLINVSESIMVDLNNEN